LAAFGLGATAYLATVSLTVIMFDRGSIAGGLSSSSL
jgi:hypothetical protein